MRPPATIIVRPDPAPCVLPKWPVPISLAGTERDLYAEIGRYVLESTAYRDANELCRKATRPP